MDVNVYKKNLKDYIYSLPQDDGIKNALYNEDFITQNPEFYLYYPMFFSEAFDLSSSDLKELCIAGYLYYQSSIFLDEIIDDKNNDKLFLTIICQEETIKILTRIFGDNKTFWGLWNKRRNELVTSLHFEKSCFQKQTVENEEYYTLSDLKSAFGKAAIDSVFCLSKKDGVPNEKTYDDLIKSHYYFSIAFQINDDIIDMQKDWANGQFNIANYRMRKLHPTVEDVSLLKKYLYINNDAKTLYLEAISALDKAIDVVKDLNVTNWKNNLFLNRRKILNTISEIDNYIKTLTAKVRHSNELYEFESLEKSIGEAIKYISDRQNNDGSWCEYINQGGISDVWSTAFIGNKIFDIPELKFEFQKAIKFVENSMNDDFLWGYNKTWINDCDSTNFALLSLLLANKKIKQECIDSLNKFQREDGGFSTYNDQKLLLESLNDININDVGGWCQSHQCVTAVTLYIKSYLKRDLEDILNYIKKIEIKNITSYWWSSPIYVYYYLSYSYNIIDCNTELDKIIEEISSLQLEDGSFKTNCMDDRVFYTAMALEILMFDYDKHVSKVNKAVSFLMKNQYKDGSWTNSNALLIPDPSKDVWDVKNFPISSIGVGVRAQEFDRLFTTSTVLKSLNGYNKQRAISSKAKQ